MSNDLSVFNFADNQTHIVWALWSHIQVLSFWSVQRITLQALRLIKFYVFNLGLNAPSPFDPVSFTPSWCCCDKMRKNIAGWRLAFLFCLSLSSNARPNRTIKQRFLAVLIVTPYSTYFFIVARMFTLHDAAKLQTFILAHTSQMVRQE